MFFNKSLSARISILNDLEDYLLEIENGNYAYQPKSTGWTIKQACNIIMGLLAYSELLNDKNLLRNKILEIDNAVTIPQLGHLLASLNLLKNKNKTLTYESMGTLPGLLNQVNAGMPGPCLIYLVTIEHSTFSNIKKMNLVNEIISYLQPQMNTFAPLSDKVFKNLVSSWMNLYNQMPETIKEKLAYRSIELKNQLADCLTDVEINMEQTIIDELIITTWDKLSINTEPELIIKKLNL